MAEDNGGEHREGMGGVGRKWAQAHDAVRRSHIALRRMLQDGNYDVLLQAESSLIPGLIEGGSYVVARKRGEDLIVITSSPLFREIFHYDEGIHGKKFTEILRPSGGDREDSLANIIAVGKERHMSLPIYDGENREVLTYISIGTTSRLAVPLRFLGHKREEEYFYTPLEVIDVGEVIRKEGEFAKRSYYSTRNLDKKNLSSVEYQDRVKRCVEILRKVKGGENRRTIWDIDKGLRRH